MIAEWKKPWTFYAPWTIQQILLTVNRQGSASLSFSTEWEVCRLFFISLQALNKHSNGGEHNNRKTLSINQVVDRNLRINNYTYFQVLLND